MFRHEDDLNDWIDATTSCDGRERQRAIEELGRRMDARALPALLIRVNDWVPQVRREALFVVRRFLDEKFIDGWIEAVPQIEALHRARRTQHGEFLQAVDLFLSRPACLARLAGAVIQPSQFVRRWLFNLQLRGVADEGDRYRLLETAIVGCDVMIAAAAVACIESLALEVRRARLAGAGCLSSFASIRLASLRSVLRYSTDGTRSLLRGLCFDVSAAVRMLAFAALSEAEQAEVLALAVSHLVKQQGAAREQATALALLCAARHVEAEALCLHATKAPAPVLRRTGYAGRLALASGASLDDLILQVMSDSSSKVRQLAVERVKRGAPLPCLRYLIGLVRRDVAGLRQVLQMMSVASPWDRLLALLQLLDDALLVSHKADFLVELDRWCVDVERCFLAPAAFQRQALGKQWQQSRLVLPDTLTRRIEFHLDQFKLTSTS